MSAPMFLNASGLMNPYGGRPCFAIQVGPYQSGELRVVHFRGDERLSQPFSYDVTIATPLGYSDVKAAVCGQPVRLAMESPGGSASRVEGVIATFSALGASTRQDGSHVYRYRVTIVPRLQLLAKRNAYRVFENQSLLDIALAILAESSIKPDVRLDPAQYLPVPCMIQRGDSDLEFVNRLFALAGISYFFEHPVGAPSDFPMRVRLSSFTPPPAPPPSPTGLNPNEVMVLVDSAARMTAVDGTNSLDGTVTDADANSLAYDPSGGHGIAQESVSMFEARDEIAPWKVTACEWSIFDHVATEQTAMFETSTTSAEAALEMTEYQREAALLPSLETFQQQNLAARSLARLRGTSSSGHGKSDCRRLAPGYRFTLGTSTLPYPFDELNVPYYVTAVRCEGTNLEELDKNATADVYKNEFECAPATLDPRPEKPKVRAQLGGEAATVISVYDGSDGFPEAEERGRIRVRFHWGKPRDREKAPPRVGTTGECSVRWFDQWAGDEYGTWMLPRVGSEVWVDFPQEGESPKADSQPRGQGNRPPFAPFDGPDTNKVGILAKSQLARDKPTTYVHEISIDTTPDQERILVRSAQDMETEVLQDSTVRVGGVMRLEVTGEHTRHVGGDDRQTVLGHAVSELRGDRATVVMGSDRTDVHGGSSLTVVGGRVERIIGPARSDVVGDAIHNVDGTNTEDVAHDDIRTIGKRQVVTVGLGSDPVLAMLNVHGDREVNASGTVRYRVTKGFEILCGTSLLEVTPSGVHITADTYTVTAAKQIELTGAGPSLTLSDTAQIMAKEITLQSSGGALDLSSSASSLTGSAIKLSSGSGSQGQTSPASSIPQYPPTPLTFVAPDGTVLKNCTYQMRAAGALTSGTTDGAGTIQALIPPDADAVQITVWTATFPDGPRVTFSLTNDTLSDPSGIKGAQQRLRNLGLYHGPIDGQMNVPLADALLVFQSATQIPLSGHLDSSTTAKLSAIHP